VKQKIISLMRNFAPLLPYIDIFGGCLRAHGDRIAAPMSGWTGKIVRPIGWP
jgi:hypothetical protein